MRNILIKVYSFNELSEKAQKKAVHNELTSQWSVVDCLMDEFIYDKKLELFNLGFFSKRVNSSGEYVIEKAKFFLKENSNKADIHFNCFDIISFYKNKKQLYLLMRFLRKNGYYVDNNSNICSINNNIFNYLTLFQDDFIKCNNSSLYVEFDENIYTKYDIEVLKLIEIYFDNLLYNFSVNLAKEYDNYCRELTSFDFIANYLQDCEYEFYSNGELYSE